MANSIEQPCYTLINATSESETYNEMQLKMDLGIQIGLMLWKLVCAID